ncbi:MAG: DUF1385 domain-containing protein [Coriobacteriia bacterium]|nr:DUF1385 domain-containing protein [Coriobacteriia bacterium]
MSDSAAAVERMDCPITHTHIGGQAVLEGIMMRGKFNWAVAVRTADGSIHTEEHDLRSAAKKHGWMRKPVIRGVVALVETLALAMKAFTVSASLAGETEDEQLTPGEITFSLVMGIGLAIGIFIILPAVVTNLTGLRATENPFRWNIVDGVLRVVAFFLYIWAISRMKDIQRVFAYHGAEHKTIHAYEHGLPLETPVIQRWSTQHMRCGTSFLLMVMVIAILVFSLVPVKAIAAQWGITNTLAILGLLILSRIILMPLVAGLAYEVTVKWAGANSGNPIVKMVLWPGLQLQRMTTREPDDEMIEVAVAAMSLVVAREELEERGGEIVAEDVAPEPEAAETLAEPA